MAYSFGGYTLDSFTGGLGNIIRSKNIDMPVLNPVLFNVGRLDGAIKSGETIGTRDIKLLLKIVGSSRADMTTRRDALQKALSLRGQQLCIQEDGRYYKNVDCISAEATLAGGADVHACNVPIAFRAYDPYAYKSTSSSHDTGTVTLTLANNVWNFAAISVTGGGTYYAYPTIRLTNKTSTGSTTLSAGLTSGNNYTSISVNATSFSGAVGDDITVTHGGTTQTLNVTSAFSVGATSISVTSFQAATTYSSGDAVAKVTQWTAITISQTQDSSTLTTYSTSNVPLPLNNNDYVDVQCDPYTGMSIETNATGELHDPVGIFPVMQPDTTTFNVSITCASEVKAAALFSWTARYLS